MPPVPPIIIPGTTYVIFLLILAAIIVLILFFRILLKFNSIRKKWLLYLQKRAYKKNADDAVKKIKRLLKTSKVTDIEFCSSMQAITILILDLTSDSVQFLQALYRQYLKKSVRGKFLLKYLKLLIILLQCS